MRAFATMFCALIVSTTVQASAIEIPIGTNANLAIHDVSCLCLYRWPTFSHLTTTIHCSSRNTFEPKQLSPTGFQWRPSPNYQFGRCF